MSTDRKVEAADIQRLGEALHGVSVPQNRAETIAGEVNALNGTVREEVRGLAYDVDSPSFAAVLQSLKRTRRPR